MRHPLFVVTVLVVAPALVAQEKSATPLPALAAKLDNTFAETWFTTGAISDEPVHAALLGDAAWLATAIAEREGRVLVRTPSLVTAILPTRALLEIAADPRTKRVKVGHRIVPPQSDAQPAPRRATTTDVPLDRRPYAVQNMGLDRLDPAQRLTGAGVLIACIECGGLPDFRHPDLRGPDGKTRFDAIWDQRVAGDASAGAPYGKLYDRAAIDALLQGDGAAAMTFGEASAHFTQSVAAAAGNGGALGKYRGIAPEATLLGVVDTLDTPGMIEAVDFAFARADALGKACVVSISETLQGLDGSVSDGHDLASVAITELAQQKPGRVVVSSAGNNGHIARHAKVVLTGYGPVRTAQYWLAPTSMDSGRALHTLCFASDVKPSLRMRIRRAGVTPEKQLEELAATPWLALADVAPARFDLVDAEGAGRLVEVVPHYGDAATRWLSLVFCKPANAQPARGQQVYIVELEGEGSVDAWASIAMLMETTPAEVVAKAPRDYVTPDSFYSVESPACAPGVIAVGVFANDDTFAFAGPSAHTDFAPPGTVMGFSQTGGPIEGTWKPLVVVGGQWVPAAVPLDLPGESEELLEGGLHRLYAGTSCASPVLAGLCGLYLQAHPEATGEDVRAALRRASFEDAATTPTPNPKVGYGKVSAAVLLGGARAR